ncbi:hypothetical protein [Solihabitans fulvus]|uniref:hypothetical protein n=1 Tax=Solihabitans fulvus TaxID=1892852 RepID=UPI001661F08E|nr:hypothetical protein [Solihabitans fulvus]
MSKPAGADTHFAGDFLAGMPTRRTPGPWRGLRLSAGLMLACVPLSLLLMGFTDITASHDGSRNLSTVNLVLGFLPLVAVGLGILLTVAGGGLAARRGTPTLPWLVASWSVFLVSVVPAVIVIGRGW